MSTPSTIARQTKDGVEAIYCNFDGDLVGATLLRHYNDDELARQLIALGDISDIARSETTVAITAYHRDREEPWDEVCPRSYPDLETTMDGEGDMAGSEYFYFWTGTEWEAYIHGDKALITEMEY